MIGKETEGWRSMSEETGFHIHINIDHRFSIKPHTFRIITAYSESEKKAVITI